RPRSPAPQGAGSGRVSRRAAPRLESCKAVARVSSALRLGAVLAAAKQPCCPLADWRIRPAAEEDRPGTVSAPPRCVELQVVGAGPRGDRSGALRGRDAGGTDGRWRGGPGPSARGRNRVLHDLRGPLSRGEGGRGAPAAPRRIRAPGGC